MSDTTTQQPTAPVHCPHCYAERGVAIPAHCPHTMRARFTSELTAQYVRLFETEDYAYAAMITTPEALAVKMTAGLTNGSANKDGDGIKRTCKALGIPYTYAAIRIALTPCPPSNSWDTTDPAVRALRAKEKR